MLHAPSGLGPDDLLAAALPDLAVTRGRTPAPGPWLAGDDPQMPPFRLIRSAGQPCLWHRDRLVEIARDLDRAASLLDQLETASGWRFEPARCIDAPEASATILSLADEESTLELAWPGSADLPERLRTAALAAPLRRDRPFPVRLVLSGPALLVDEAADLAPGDLLLLPTVASVRVEAPAGTSDGNADLNLDLETGLLARAVWDGDAASATRNAFLVPVAVALPPALIAPDELAAVGEGTPLLLGPVREGAHVTLGVGGRPFGAGTIVRLGSRLAVELGAVVDTGACSLEEARL